MLNYVNFFWDKTKRKYERKPKWLDDFISRLKKLNKICTYNLT